MVEILEAKLAQYPQLTEIITNNGGAAWLNKCSHVVNAPDSFWSGVGLNSGFITALITAYRKIANDTSSLCIVKSELEEITKEPQDDSITILDKYVSYEPTSLSLRISFNNKTKAQQWGRYLNTELFISDTFSIKNSLKENWKYDLVVPTVSEYEANTLAEIINFGLPPSENNPNTEAQAA